MYRATRTILPLLCATLISSTAVAAPPSVPPSAGAAKPGVNIPAVPKPRVYARIVIDSLYCQKESKWDHGSSQDEPYVMVTGFASHRNPNAWMLGEPEVFGDVDTGNSRRFTKQNTVVYEGEVPKDAGIGFHVVLWERDSSPQDTRRNIYQQLCRRINDNFVTCMDKGGDVAGIAGTFTGMLTGLLPSIYAAIIQQVGSIAGGGGDDKVADASVGIDYSQIVEWAKVEPTHKAFRVELKGGDEGHYWLRYHVEFQEDCTRAYEIGFTEWDDIAVGNVNGTPGDEIVIAAEGEGANGSGRCHVYNGDGSLARSFDAPYARFDRLAIGNIEGGLPTQIVLASPKDGGLIRTYDNMGKPRDRFNIPFAKYDGFAVADVVGDAAAEVIVASRADKKVLIYSGKGVKIDEFGLNWTFKGARYTGSDTRHDAFLAGDVLGDGKAEIITIENKDGSESIVRVYDGKGGEVRKLSPLGAVRSGFHECGAASLGNLQGDSKKELILAAPDFQEIHTNTMYVLDLAKGERVGMRHGPWFAKYDGFAAGSLISTDRDQLIVASRADRKVYLSR